MKTKTATFSVSLFKVYPEGFLLLERLEIKITRQVPSKLNRQAIAELTIAYLLLGKQSQDFDFRVFDADIVINRNRESLNSRDVAELIKIGENINVVSNRASIRDGNGKLIWEIGIDIDLPKAKTRPLKDVTGRSRSVSILAKD